MRVHDVERVRRRTAASYTSATSNSTSGHALLAALRSVRGVDDRRRRVDADDAARAHAAREVDRDVARPATDVEEIEARPQRRRAGTRPSSPRCASGANAARSRGDRACTGSSARSRRRSQAGPRASRSGACSIGFAAMGREIATGSSRTRVRPVTTEFACATSATAPATWVSRSTGSGATPRASPTCSAATTPITSPTRRSSSRSTAVVSGYLLGCVDSSQAGIPARSPARHIVAARHRVPARHRRRRVAHHRRRRRSTSPAGG